MNWKERMFVSALVAIGGGGVGIGLRLFDTKPVIGTVIALVAVVLSIVIHDLFCEKVFGEGIYEKKGGDDHD
jgi:hypothetical protein